MSNDNGNGNGGELGSDARPVMPQRQVQHEMKILIFDNGQIAVTDIPANFDDAMGIMASAYRAVANLFVQEALRGRTRPALRNGGILVPQGCGGIIIPS